MLKQLACVGNRKPARNVSGDGGAPGSVLGQSGSDLFSGSWAEKSEDGPRARAVVITITEAVPRNRRTNAVRSDGLGASASSVQEKITGFVPGGAFGISTF